jgi:tetratricopeptide (TPR) repeat protein
MRIRNGSFGIVGALAAFPLRLAAKRAAGIGARLHRGLTRRTTHAVFGRKLLARPDQALMERRIEQAKAGNVELLSENAFLRLLGSLPSGPAAGDLKRQSLLDQSGLNANAFDHLALFDAFEHHAEPFSFRDLILARKYAGLLATGAGWSAIARSVHDIGPVGSLTAMTLRAAGAEKIVMEDSHSLAELDGQRLLKLDDGGDEAEDYFGLAEIAEAAELWAEAATLYGHCASIDVSDATSAFNQGNCLRTIGDTGGAGLAFVTAIKRDPEFVEAWFNYGGILRDTGKPDAARQHLRRAVELDATYADAVYNLAALEYDGGHLGEARDLWRRYLELDTGSDWARRARAGIALADRQLRKTAG